MEFALQINDNNEIALCFIWIGILFLAQGLPQKFVRLLGIAEYIAPKDFWQSAFSYFRNATHQAVESARAALGEETFAAVYEQGKNMSLEEAVVFAIEET